jgi:putative inorganic carbon (HCO3(-)) transporter
MVLALLAVLGIEAAAVATGSRVVAFSALALYAAAFVLLLAADEPLAVVALVVAIPLVTVEIGIGAVERTVSTDKVVLLAVLAFGLVRLAVRWRTAAFRSAAARWWLVLLAVVALSALRAPAVGEAKALLEQLALATVFVTALCALTRDARLVDRLLVAAALTGGVVAALALVEGRLAAWGVWTPMYFKAGTMLDPFRLVGGQLVSNGGPVMYGGPIAHRNFLAAYLVLTTPLLAAVAIAYRRARASATLGVVLSLLALLQANSMGGWAGLATAALTAAVLGAGGATARTRRALVAACLVVVALAGSVIAVKLFARTAGVVSLSVRSATYRVGAAEIAEHPLLGRGEDGFRREYLRLERQLFGRPLLEFHALDEPLSAHSSFLDLAVERGLCGLAAFLGLLAAVLLGGIRTAVASAGRPRVWAIAIVGAAGGVIVQAFTENLFEYSKVASIFWILMAVLVVLSRPALRLPAVAPAARPASAPSALPVSTP